MKRFGALFFAVFIISSGAYASGSAKTYSLDKSYTSIEFKVSYLLLARVTGQFNDFNGSFVIDSKNPQNNRADIIIQTASVDTGNKMRDDDIRGSALFDTERFPTMVFHSDAIEIRPDNSGQIMGDLTLLGVTKPVILDLVKTAGANGDFVDGFKVTGKIKRSDFGMNAFVRPIGNVVTLLVCYNVQDCRDEDVRHNTGQATYNQ